MRMFVVAAVCAASVCAFAATSEASSLTLNFEGHVTDISDAAGLLNGLGFNVGDTFQLSATLPDPTPPPDYDPRPLYGDYAFDAGPSSLTLSGYSFSATRLQIEFTDATPADLPWTDNISLNPYGHFSSTIPSPVNWFGYNLSLGSGDTTTLNSDVLDFSSSLWSNYVLSNLSLSFFDDRIQGQQFASMVVGVVDSVSLNSSQVPEPGSLILFGTGLMTLARRARRRQARARETRA